MASTTETGHAKNAANFQILISFVTAYGATYNPSKATLKLPQLNLLAATAQSSIADVITKNTAYNNTINTRLLAFKDLKALATRLVNALETTDATPEKINDAKGFNRKLQGKKAATDNTSTVPNEPVSKRISTSQQSYDQQIQHFAGLLSVLQSEPTYLPNEVPLKITTLTAKQTDLLSKNNAVATAYATLSNARIARNKIIYDPNAGLIDTASEVKKYIKSVFGATSPQFAQLKAIRFKKIEA